MRFKVKPTLSFDYKKSVIRFAFIPKRIQDHIVWLEKYECVYTYSYNRVWDYYYWKVCETKLIKKQD